MISPVRDFTRVRLNFRQQFLTAPQARALPPLRSTDGAGFAAVAQVKFFAGAYTWFATEFDPVEELFFGYCYNAAEPSFSEFGYFSAAELSARQTPDLRQLGNGRYAVVPVVERDIHFRPQSVGEAVDDLTGGRFDPAGVRSPAPAAEPRQPEPCADY